MKFRKLFTALLAACALVATPVIFTSCTNDDASESGRFIPITPTQLVMINGDVITLEEGSSGSASEDSTINDLPAYNIKDASGTLIEGTIATGTYAYEESMSNAYTFTLTLYYSTNVVNGIVFSYNKCAIKVAFDTARTGTVVSITSATDGGESSSLSDHPATNYPVGSEIEFR